ncbi:MAG: GntR family transcriptional regulator [Tetrasphaera sp.]
MPDRGRTDWLTRHLRRAIVDGQLPHGGPLPPSRRLAADLALSRGVVVEAYRRLADEGLVTTKTGAGSSVTPGPLISTPPLTAASADPSLPMLAAGGNPGLLVPFLPRRPSPDVRLRPLGWRAGSRGLPSSSLAARRARGPRRRHGNRPGVWRPRGHPRLRTEIAAYLARLRGCVRTRTPSWSSLALHRHLPFSAKSFRAPARCTPWRWRTRIAGHPRRADLLGAPADAGHRRRRGPSRRGSRGER